ncbi:YibE/F family protein [Evansella cellulosilytica]|uniref:YibE/F family protein n=1 Tax=Evansella cellulosilytica (strain ATCC 21833 / DSM 2522 / FERM P-1141 / JCM 9156 / N-4) TaxID=649639 RepID=E6TQU6_EVAC2|nr:YibE/F family protein [Evansella cellulosilytica]ADU31721.1 YibE/F family protein [Evansella cellulosilytica DSM 2522]
MKPMFIFALLLMFSVIPSGLAKAMDDTDTQANTERLKAEVVSIIEEEQYVDEFSGNKIGYQSVEVKLLTGEWKNEVVIAERFNYPEDIPIWVEENDKIMVQLEMNHGEIVRADVMDYARDYSTLVLISIFVALLIALGRKQGLKAVLTLGFTLVIVFKFMIPNLLAGYNPVLLAIVTGGIVTALTFTIVSGFTRKTLAAVVGTIGGLASAAIISIIFSSVMNLTGLHGDDERMLLITSSQEMNLDFKGLLLAGIIIGALGAVMDVAISIASSMEEVRKTDRMIPMKKLFTSGMNVGKDIMGTMSNTLILAYVGAALPLLLIIYSLDNPLTELIHREFLAVEILRTAAGSIGLILSIPITAFVASIFIKKSK